MRFHTFFLHHVAKCIANSSVGMRRIYLEILHAMLKTAVISFCLILIIELPPTIELHFHWSFITANSLYLWLTFMKDLYDKFSYSTQVFVFVLENIISEVAEKFWFYVIIVVDCISFYSCSFGHAGKNFKKDIEQACKIIINS